ncbi:MAG: acetylornithine/succinylornithine family transaminase [Acidimicrobiales bacterium]
MSGHSSAMDSSLEACPMMSNYGPPPVLFIRGAGTEIWDANDKRYLDFLTGLAVVSLGHSHPAITKAIVDQAATLMHTSNLFATEYQEPVARILDQLIAGKPGQVLFQNSGAEANEAAIKLARKLQGRGRHKVLSAFRSFHGRTLATLAATGQPEKHEPFQPLPDGFIHAAWNDLDEFAKAITPEVGTIILEPLQGEGGVNEASKEFFVGVRQLCDDHRITLILDEIQTGLGRTGEWFGFQHFDIEPDIVTMAKALGNGFPIGAVWARRDAAAAFQPGDHGSTFAGQPLATAAALATLEVMQDIDAPEMARATGLILSAGLAKLPHVQSVRGLGLLVAVELDCEGAKSVAASCLEHGLIVNALSDTAIRLAPPLNVTKAHTDEALTILGEQLAQLGQDT